jgi:hypothetical protein
MATPGFIKPQVSDNNPVSIRHHEQSPLKLAPFKLTKQAPTPLEETRSVLKTFLLVWLVGQNFTAENPKPKP